MVIPDLKHFCFALLLSLVSISACAEIYKWVDDAGITHFAESPPAADHPVETITPPPAPASSEIAQEEIDALIAQQQEQDKARQQAQQEAEQLAEQAAIKKENCRLAQHNLNSYQNNPGRRVTDADGNVTRMIEEERQQKIKEFQQQVKEFCP